MSFKQSLIVALIVCSQNHMLVAQNAANVLKGGALAAQSTQHAELPPQMLNVHPLLNAREVLSLLETFGYHHQGIIAESPTTNQIIIRAPQKVVEEIAMFVRKLEDEAQHQASEKQHAEKILSLQIKVPSGSTFKWVGGDGGLTQSPSGIVYSFKAPGSNVFRLTNIPRHEGLVVEARIDIPQIDAEIAAVMSSTLNLVVASPSDLMDLAKGVSIHKFITGPHALTADQTELFGEVVKRGDETLREGSPETKGKGIVAVVHLTGVISSSSQPSGFDPLVSRSAPTPKKSAEAIHGQSTSSADSTVAAADVASVSREYSASEDRVTELAAMLRKLGGADSEKATIFRKQLTEAVISSFNLRQQLHQTQIDVQRAKLNALERRVVRRSESAQQIINRRVAEILKTAGVSVEAASAKDSTSADKNLAGEVSIEYVEDLDILTVRGKKDDVERTLNVIEKIKQQKEQTTAKGTDKR